MVARKHLGLAVEMEEERRARPENDEATKWLRLAMETDKERKIVATKWLRLAIEMDEERNARLEKMVATTQLRLALDRGRKKSKTGTSVR